MRKTKIVCTLGPASNSREVIERLVDAGMDVVRSNFSHGTHQEAKNSIEKVREVEDKTGKTIGIMLDTQGPEVRTGKVKDDGISIKAGEEIVLTTEKNVIGDKTKISISYKDLPQDVDKGDKILIDDGLIELKVLNTGNKEINCKIINGGTIVSKRGVNIPGVSLDLPALTKKDIKDIEFGIKMRMNFIAVSFVRTADDVNEVRDLLHKKEADEISIIAKIENQEAVNNIDEIIEVADGIMVARGDLGVEIPPENVPYIQKEIINKCNKQAKPVITATQMLNSMIENPRPTRAEASDVANAIYDGTDAVMLSGETAVGKYPVATVQLMDKIARETEKSDSYQKNTIYSYTTTICDSVTEAISYASCKTAMDLKAKCIITSTSSGYTARMVAKDKPAPPIMGVTPNKHVKHFLSLVWGVYPLQVEESETTDEMINKAISAVKDHGFVEKGDLVTITAGVPVGVSGTTNLVEVVTVGEEEERGKI